MTDMIAPRRFSGVLLLSLLLFSLAFFAYYGFPLPSFSGGALRLPHGDDHSPSSGANGAHFFDPSSAHGNNAIQPANGTLGFGGIFVVSSPGSVRRDHLEQAAAVTELDLIIPEQKEWSDEDLQEFRGEVKKEDSKAGVGSIKAWLSHHLVLQAFLDSGLETALIIENDVDWDIHLRTQQVPLSQRASSQLLSNGQDAERHPWGRSADWDLLWIGTCGDYWGPVMGFDASTLIGVGHRHPSDLNKVSHIVFEDPTCPYYSDQHPWTASLLTAFRIPERHRVIHKSQFPLCTFAYAVTREGAQKIMTKVAPANAAKARHASAFDIAMLDGCGWQSEMIRCYSMQPELFHHMLGGSLIQKEEKNPSLPPVQQSGSEQFAYRQETTNIGCGFWSGDFYWDGNQTQLDYLRENVGRKGRCLKPGRDA